jgi:hypothetical protein
MTHVLKTKCCMAIYDDQSTLFYCVKLIQKYGLEIKKKNMDMVFGEKFLLPESK